MQHDYSTWGLEEARATALLAQYDQGYTIAQPITEAVLETVREMSLVLALSQRADDGYQLQERLHAALRIAYANDPAADYLAEALLDATAQSLRRLPYQPERFEPYTELHPLIQQFAGRSGRFVYLQQLAMVHMRQQYYEWPLNGGLPDKLPADERKYLDGLANGFFEQLTAVAAAHQSEPKLWWNLMHLLADEYFHDALPNDALRVRKAVVNAWAGDDTVDVVLRAEAAFYLAMLYTEYEKWAQALPYFEQAQALYAQASSDYEGFMWQAEGWAEKCKGMLAG